MPKLKNSNATFWVILNTMLTVLKFNIGQILIVSNTFAGTTFEDYWPAKGSIEPVHHSQRVSAGNWTQKPVSVVPQNQQPNQPPPPAHGNNRAGYNNSQHSAAMAASYAQQMNTAAVAAAQRTYIESLQRSQLAQAAQAAQASQAAAAAAVQQVNTTTLFNLARLKLSTMTNLNFSLIQIAQLCLI